GSPKPRAWRIGWKSSTLPSEGRWAAITTKTTRNPRAWIQGDAAARGPGPDTRGRMARRHARHEAARGPPFRTDSRSVLACISGNKHGRPAVGRPRNEWGPRRYRRSFGR